jgi:hypothetical protein
VNERERILTMTRKTTVFIRIVGVGTLIDTSVDQYAGLAQLEVFSNTHTPDAVFFSRYYIQHGVFHRATFIATYKK